MSLSDLKLRVRALFRPNRVERELDDELTFHIEREAAKLIEQGVSPDDARLRARARFGSPTVVADECRDERGIGVIENTVRDLTYSIRAILKAPLANLTIIVTVAIGLGLVAVVFSLLNVFLFRIDHVPDINEIYEVGRPRTGQGDRQLFVRSHFDALQRETQVFSGVFAELPDIDSRIDGRMMGAVLVTGNFFQVLGRHAVMGRTLLPSDDMPGAGEPVMVLSYRGWTREFDGDPQIIGRRVIVNGAPHEIVGVMPDGFRGLEVSAPDYWAPLSMMAEHRPQHRGREGSIGLTIIGRLRPGVSKESARAQLDAWDAQRTGTAGTDRRAVAIELLPRRGTVPQPMEAVIVFTPLFLVVGLILMIGCANVANLLLARSVSRQKEIGIRLSLGASRGRIVRQLLVESLLLSLVASVAGYVLARSALAAAIAALMRSMPVDLGHINLAVPGADWRVGVFLVFSAVMATAMFALMPALQATRIDPVRTLRGEIVKDARPGRSRNILIGVQVSASALLLICSAVFLRSSFASATVDPGFRTQDVVLVDVINEPKREVMVQAVRSDPSVLSAAAAWPDMTSFPKAATILVENTKHNAGYRMVSPEYFDILGIPLMRGRAFTAEESTGQLPVAIVNESLANTLFPRADAVGQTIQIEPDLTTRNLDNPPLMSRTVTIIGVSRDVAGFRIMDTKEASLYIPVHSGVAHTGLVTRVHGDPDQVRRALLDRLTLVDPNMGQILTMRTMARMETYFLQIAFWVTLVLGGLALSLTVSGLFSVLSYLVEQRAKEIGVRMALGATAQSVTRLVITQTSRPVLIGLACGAALALALATVLLSVAGAGMIGEVIHVFDPIAYAMSLVTIVAACLAAAAIPAARASRLDPMRTLREE